MCIRRIAGAAVASALVFAGPAWAGEQALKFRLVVTDVSVTDLEAANVPGRSVGTVKSTGVAFFEDGRIAKKDFVRFYDGTADAGDFTGYSTYTFDNGELYYREVRRRMVRGGHRRRLRGAFRHRRVPGRDRDRPVRCGGRCLGRR